MENQVLSISQMQELQELGIDTSKASMVWSYYEPSVGNEDEEGEYQLEINDWIPKKAEYPDVPAFTLQDCIKLIPCYIEDEYGNGFLIRYSKDFAWYQEEFGNGTLIVFDNCNFILENCFNMLKWCKQNNYI